MALGMGLGWGRGVGCGGGIRRGGGEGYLILQYNTMLCKFFVDITYTNAFAIYYIIRYDTIRYDTIRYDTIRYNAMQFNSVRILRWP